MIKDWNHQYAQVNGVRLHYVQEGKGDKLIVLLHGWPEFWYSWRHQIRALSPHYTVVAPDLRGFNESEKPSKQRDYVQDVVGRDIVELIRHLGFERAVIVGHDWGGAIAWHLAMNYPEIVSGFIVLNCPHPGLFIKNMMSSPSQVLKSWYMIFFQIPLLPEFLIGLNLEAFFKRAMREWALNKHRFTDEVIARYVEAYSRPGALTGGINYYRANIQAARSMMKSKGKNVQAPTLMIWGEADQALGKELTEGTDAYIDGSFRIHFIPDCSHWVQNDCPDEVNRVILEFLSEP